jgi:glucose 1-dehydrogenase
MKIICVSGTRTVLVAIMYCREDVKMRGYTSVMLSHHFLCAMMLLMAVNSYSIYGKRVLVTGSSGGIGSSIARRLAKEGAQIYLHYNSRKTGALSTRDVIQKEGGICLGIIQCDFRQDENIYKLFDILPTPIDILINNAGVVTKLHMDDDITLSLWKETLQVNLHAPLLLSKLAKQQMKDGGVIINVSSIHGEKSVEYMGAYAASKAGLDSITRSLALEWAVDNVRVNTIAPGVVPVERTVEAFQDPVMAENWKKHLPLRRWGTVEEIAEAILSLITIDWVTGTVWTVDGGMMARSNMPQRARPSLSSMEEVPINNVVSFEI